jgi:hypothetical protein
MIAQKGLPALRRWLPSPRHVFCHGGLPDIDAKLDQQVAKMPLAEDNDMVKTIPSDRTDEPLRVSVLPWRPWRDWPIPYTHCSKPLDDDIAIDAIPIAIYRGVCCQP